MKTAKGGRKHRSAVSFCCDSSFAAPRGGRDANPPADYDVNPISTRAPRTGRDERAPHRAWGLPISIRAPRAGRDAPGMDYNLDRCKFQSARPIRGATRPTLMVRYISSYFNPRAPCGARPTTPRRPRADRYFNPRAPCGARQPPSMWSGQKIYFNPRAPCGARQSTSS